MIFFGENPLKKNAGGDWQLKTNQPININKQTKTLVGKRLK